MAVCSTSVDDGARNPFRASTARRDQLRLAAEVIARSRCVSVLSRSHQPVGDCGGTPSPNAKLVLVAFRTRLTAMKNIRSRSAGGGDMDPYSSAAHDQCKIGSLLSNDLHERADPRIGMQKRKRGAKVGKSGRRSGAQRYLPLVISARWTPISQHFPADRRLQTLLRSRQSNRSLMQCRPRTCGSGEIGVCLQHLGILIGRRAHEQVWPQIFSWINSR